jgi:hypothetical protein
MTPLQPLSGAAFPTTIVSGGSRENCARYDFALVNRRHIVAATEAPQGMIRERNVL